MAGKISELTAAPGALADGDEIELLQGGGNYRAALSTAWTYLLSKFGTGDQLLMTAAERAKLAALDAVLVLSGSWDASAGTFPGGGAAQAGYTYIVSVAGTVDSVDFSASDRIICLVDNASTATYSANWIKADYSDLSTITTGAGAPVSAPLAIGHTYIDTTNDVAYWAKGTATAADWIQLIDANSGNVLTNVATVGSDLIPFFDISDSNKPKQRTWTEVIADLAIVTTARVATLTQTGIAELATTAEINTGTDAARVMGPAEFAASRYGTKEVTFNVFHATEDCVVGDQANDFFYRVPSSMNGMKLVAIEGASRAAGVTNTMDIQLHNISQAVDVLSTLLTIDDGEADSSTAAVPPVINSSNNTVATGDLLRVDLDAVHTTPAKGLSLNLQFRIS